jgi:hypothetical protein
MYKRKYKEAFDAWWRPLTRQGDPSHRYDLVGEAFDAGYEAGKNAALVNLGKNLIAAYGTPLDTEGRPTQETPADLVGALQDKIHTDAGPFRAGKSVKETPADCTCLLPNDHHPGPRCSCRECLRQYPTANREVNDGK